MKDIKIIIDGKEIAATIDDAVRQQLLQPAKKTGYERAKKYKGYYFVDFEGDIAISEDINCIQDNDVYNAANYYSDKTVAENNARADKLMRQLRRFAVEHRERSINWKKADQNKFYIYYTNKYGISIGDVVTLYDFGVIYFDTKETAQLAIDTFKDELLWYFTEYKDSL